METNLKYGVIIGKFSKAWHKGHQSIVDAVQEDGLEPILLIGSSQESGTDNCPLDIDTRLAMIRQTNPTTRMFPMEDRECWTEWHDKIVEILTENVTDNLDEVCIYTHNKPEDLHSVFTFKGVDYFDSYYSEIFEVEGMHTKNLPISGIAIRGTQIHENLEGNKRFLDYRTYNFLKELK